MITIRLNEGSRLYSELTTKALLLAIDNSETNPTPTSSKCWIEIPAKVNKKDEKYKRIMINIKRILYFLETEDED